MESRYSIKDVANSSNVEARPAHFRHFLLAQQQLCFCPFGELAVSECGNKDMVRAIDSRERKDQTMGALWPSNGCKRTAPLVKKVYD